MRPPSLPELELEGWGRFTDEPCGFEVQRYQLPRAWNYQLYNGSILWDLHHNGLGRIQVNPPGGLYLVKMERFQAVPSWLVWLVPDGDPARAFTNFFRPLCEPGADLREPAGYRCRFTPAGGSIELEHDEWRVETQCETVRDAAAVRLRVTVVNCSTRPRTLALVPALRPYASAANLAPWDVPELYHHTSYEDGPARTFLLRSMSPGGVLDERHNVLCVSDLPASRMALDYTLFTGRGSWERPEAVLDDASAAWRPCAPAGIRGRRAVFACRHELRLAPAGRFAFRLALGLLPGRADGGRPDAGKLAAAAGWLSSPPPPPAPAPLRRMELPDPAMGRYMTEYLDYQGRMVLHRGWPCNMLGTRDAAQDYTNVVATEPGQVRSFLLRLFEMERSDGWFVRQFSTLGRRGRHDERPYVDSSFFVWELLYLYLCQTGDWSLLDERVPFTDCDEPATILDHARRVLEYYRHPDNLGEHGFVKIREGDWNDAVNAAGLAGRGESVMASCMAVIAWRQGARLLSARGLAGSDGYAQSADDLRAALRKHALNSAGFLNGVFNDAGRWIFSDRDPDGACRLSVPVNAFGVLADIFDPAEIEPLFRRISDTINDHGVPLFWPPFGDDPIPRVGRLATGDLSAGLAENGAPYNHGSHGFLARAAAHAGLGDRLYDLLQWLFPYDQTKHPVHQTKTAPYALVNVWKTAPGWEGEGGDTFFTGGIAAGLRAGYEGLLGIEPVPEGLALHPCLPREWEGARAHFPFRDCRCELIIRRTGAAATSGEVRLNGAVVNNPVPVDRFPRGGSVRIDMIV